MNNFLKKIKFGLQFLFHSTFRGLKSADETMLAQVSGEDGDSQEISHRLEIKNVYNDLLREQKTQEVLELIDMSYRIAREADKYQVTLVGDLGDDSVGSDRPLSAIAIKKIAKKYDKHPELFNEKTYYITLVQENEKIQKKGVWGVTASDFINALDASPFDYEQNLELEYDGFTPRFAIEKFVKKMVLRETKAGKTKIDLYINAEAGQFTKTDAILIAELHRILENDLKHTDFLDIKSMKFVTDKAYGADNLIVYVISGIKYQKISLFDGNFVLTFTVKDVNTLDIVEAHKTKSLDKKYEEMAPKKDGINVEDLGAIDRRNAKLAKKKAQEATNP